MRIQSILPLGFFFFLSFWSLQGQEYTIDLHHIGVEDGLLHRKVNVIFEDANGLMWIGSEKGLQRFDGYEFKTWTKADSTQLIHQIISIGQDDEGWLWLFNGEKNKFIFLHSETEAIARVEERFSNDFSEKPAAEIFSGWHKGGRFLPCNSQGQLFFINKKHQLISYDGQRGFQIKPLENNLIDHIHFIDEKDHIWATSKDEIIYELNASGKILNTYSTEESFNAQILSKKEGEIIFLARSKNTTGKIFLKKIDRRGNIKTIKEVDSGLMVDGKFWNKRFDYGIEVFDSFDQAPIYTFKKSDFHFSLFEDVAFLKDTKGHFWSYGSYGINKIDIQANKFQKHLSFDAFSSKSFNNAIRGIWVDGDRIFANLERTATVKFNKNNAEDWTVISNEEGARALLKNKDGDFWIGNPYSIQKLNTEGQVLQKIPIKHQSLAGVWSLYLDKNERLWIGGTEQLGFKNKDENEVHLFQAKEDLFGFSQKKLNIQNMIPTADGKVWLCSFTGLYLFDPIQEKILARYARDEKGKNYLPADVFYYLYEDQSGIKWIGTAEGLIRWDHTATNEASFQLFTRIDGLSNTVIYAIFEDEQNRLWLSSDYGIMSFDKTTFAVKTYLEKDGISHHEFNRTAQFQSEDGTIYFGGLNGITSFQPKDFIQQAEEQPKMLISAFEIFDGEKERLVDKVGELRQTKTINFYPSDRFFRLKFVLPTFEDIDKILYGWKIESEGVDWNYQKENTLQFGALPYGNHTLRIKGQGADGAWSPHELAIKVNIYKPFYLQTWFLILSILGLITGAFLFHKRRTRKFLRQQNILEREIQKATQQIQKDKSIIEIDKKTIELQAQELKELDQLKSRFFANVSHELRTPLTLMLGPIGSALKRGELSNRDFTLLKTAQQNGKDLLKLIAAILDLSKMESGKMELEETTQLLFPLVRRIASNFESHAQRGGIQFQFNYEAERDLQIEVDQSKLEIILNNLLSNAVKFTPSGGKVSVVVEDRANKLKFSVRDTGRGIHQDDLPYVFDRFYQSKQANAPTEGGTGIGLALSQEFVKLMNGEIWVESELGKGSTFTFEIPRKEILGMVDSEKMLAIEQEAVEPENRAIPALAHKIDNRNGQPAILVVEDNHSLRQYLATILSKDFQVITAENGKVAVDILKNAKKSSPSKESFPSMPQLILSDIMMPIMDGFQLLETIKGEETFSHIPMIMLTARADIKDKLKALRIGVDDYLLKPFEEEELLVRIHNLLNNYQQRILAVDHFSNENQDAKATPELPIHSVEDQEWLNQLEQTLLKELANNQYSISQLAYDLAISERQLRRRIKKLIGISPAQYLKEIRLHQARELLENKQYNTIAKTATAVGFQDVRSFSRNFSAHFGKNPSEYLNI